jgi:fumarate reductase subunit C
MPGAYRRPQPWNWFLNRPRYLMFMLRELTAVLVGAYLIFLLVLLTRLGAEQAAFVDFLRTLTGPLSMIFHVVVFLAAMFHSITWFNLTPKAMPFFLGEKRVADPVIAVAMGYLPWAIVTVVIIWAVVAL